MRGRKGTKKSEQISLLKQLADVTKRPSKLVELLGHVVTFNFDIHNNMLTAMPIGVWKNIFDVYRRMLRTLVANPDLKVEQVEGTTVVDTVQMTAAEVGEDGEDVVDSGVTQMTGNLLSFLERLDDEFYKSLQLQDPHMPEYVARLKDEVPLVNLMQDTLAYYDSKKDDGPESQQEVARVAARIVEHIYYREQSLFNTAMQNAVKRKQVLLLSLETADAAAARAVEEADADDEARAAAGEAADDDDDSDGSDAPPPKAESALRQAAKAAAKEAKEARVTFDDFTVPRAMDLAQEMGSLAARVFAHGAERAKTRTMLCHVYHSALHEKYQEARDLLLMSHLADTIHQFDVPTQILYNRALVRIGISALHVNSVSVSKTKPYQFTTIISTISECIFANLQN